YQIAEQLSFHVRGDYESRSPFKGNTYPGSSFAPGLLPGKAFAATATLQYDLWKNVLSRLEFRWDHAADGAAQFGGVGALNTVPPTKRNAYLLAANIIYKF